MRFKIVEQTLAEDDRESGIAWCIHNQAVFQPEVEAGEIFMLHRMKRMLDMCVQKERKRQDDNRPDTPAWVLADMP